MDLVAEKLIDTLYLMALQNMSEELRSTCPLLRTIRDMKERVRDANAEELIIQLGLSTGAMICPCKKG